MTPNLDALATGGIILDRHIVHKFCSPSRCALQSGRSPIHVNVINSDMRQYNINDPVSGVQGIPTNMTTIAAKLASAGYSTHAVGKWNAGLAHKVQTPNGRGYATGLTYFDYDTDFWTEAKPMCGSGKNRQMTVDMWDTHGPGTQYNGSESCTQTSQAGCTYQDEVFVQRIEKIIANATPGVPLFLFWAPHAPHDPYEVPQSYLDKFSYIDQQERQFVAAMVNLLDDNVGRVVKMLTDAGLWDNTLMIASADNGGPLGDGYGGNNYPLKGGKASNWEGGVRVNAFAAGGAIPVSQRGTKIEGLIEIADWYTTFCSIAGVDPTDGVAAAAGLPAVDGLDMWPLLSGANSTSPRTHVFLGTSDDTDKSGNTLVGGVIRNDGYKLILGKQASAFWQGPEYPNSTTYPAGSENCGTAGCLYNVFTDPTEHDEISGSNPTIVADLLKLINDAQKTVFNPDRGTDDGTACEVAFSKYGGFFGPFL